MSTHPDIDHIAQVYASDHISGLRGTAYLLYVGPARIRTMSPKEYLNSLPANITGGTDFHALDLEEQKSAYLFAKSLAKLSDANIMSFAQSIGMQPHSIFSQ